MKDSEVVQDSANRKGTSFQRLENETVKESSVNFIYERQVRG